MDPGVGATIWARTTAPPGVLVAVGVEVLVGVGVLVAVVGGFVGVPAGAGVEVTAPGPYW